MNDSPPDSAETERLLAQVRNGDPRAVDQLLSLYQPYLRQVVELRLDARVRRYVDASDVVQETQLEAVRRLTDYLQRRPAPFRFWLRQMAHDRLLMARRRHVEAAERAAARDLPLPDRSSARLAQQLMAGGSTPSEHIAKRELARRVREALARLSDVDREILLMRNVEKLSYQEIAYVLQIDPAAARQRHGRALVRLNKTLRLEGQKES